jgi:hypothetical protein
MKSSSASRSRIGASDWRAKRPRVITRAAATDLIVRPRVTVMRASYVASGGVAGKIQRLAEPTASIVGSPLLLNTSQPGEAIMVNAYGDSRSG